MTPDEQARQAFETLIENILAQVQAASEADRAPLLDQTRLALREMALRHGLAEPQAARWAAEIDQELRFRLMHGAQATSNDNAL
jgi:hypothetical protein